MSTSTDRKPSSSSAPSRANSPLHSPTHVQSQRKLTSGTHFIGARVGTSPAMKTLNTGWQVWGGATSAVRDMTVSGASRSDPPPTDSGYSGDAWHANRPSGGQWEDTGSNAQRLDIHTQLALHQARQRQVGGPPISSLHMSAAGVSKGGRGVQQRYSSGLTRESGDPSLYSATSPTRQVSFRSESPFAAQQPQAHTGSGAIGPYDPSTSAATVEDKLAVALRGMAVEDEYGLSQHQAHRIPVSQPSNTAEQLHTITTQTRGLPHMQQPGAPHAVFPQADFRSYYGGPQVDYQYPFERYRAPEPMFASPALSPANAATLVYPIPPRGIHPQPSSDLHGLSPGVYYDFSGQAHAGFYYPSQHMAFQPPPIHPSVGDSPLFNKKRLGQHPLQHQGLPHQTSPYHGLHSLSALRTQGFLPMEYSAHMPMHSPTQLMFGQQELGPPIHMQAYGMRARRLDDSGGYRSPLLEEFRNDRIRSWELKEIYGHIVEFSTDQYGSRFIQQRLETATDDERQTIFDEIVPQHALELIQNVFGNYVIQKFLEYGSPAQKAVIIGCMDNNMLLLALQMYGCRVVQKAVETVTPEQQSMIVKELEENVLRCVKDANGNHVIQRLIERVEPERLSFVRLFSGHVQELATHPYGCRVLQRCFEHLDDLHTRPLLDELQRHAVRLMQDQFGNYVIQFVLEHGQEQDRSAVISQLRGRMLQMSRHKFASNVCEKALVTADPETRRALIDEIMRSRQDGSSPIVTMMKDQYANYVLQRALTVAEPEQKAVLISKMKPHLVSLRKRAGQSRHLIAIERLLAKCALEVQSFLPPDESPDVVDETSSNTQ